MEQFTTKAPRSRCEAKGVNSLTCQTQSTKLVFGTEEALDTLSTRPRLNLAPASLEWHARCRLPIPDRLPTLRLREGLALRTPRFQPPASDAPAALAAPQRRRKQGVNLVRDRRQFWCLGTRRRRLQQPVRRQGPRIPRSGRPPDQSPRRWPLKP